MKYTLLILFTLTYNFIIAQTTYKGRVTVQDEELQQIEVKNISKNSSTFTDKYGYFTLASNVGDEILFTSEFIVEKRIIVTKEDLLRLQRIYLVSKASELQEIVIQDFGKDFLKLELMQKKISDEYRGNGSMDILALAIAGIGLFKTNKETPQKQKETKEFFTLPKIKWEQNQRLLELPKEIFTKDLGLSEHLIEPFIYFVSSVPTLSQWIQSDHETLLINLKDQKLKFLEYYYKR